MDCEYLRIKDLQSTRSNVYRKIHLYYMKFPPYPFFRFGSIILYKIKRHRNTFLITSFSKYFLSKRQCLQPVNHMRYAQGGKWKNANISFGDFYFVQFKVKVQIFLKKYVSLVNMKILWKYYY